MIEAHLHPVLSSMPFALLTLASVVECLRWRGRTSGSEIVAWCIWGALITIAGAFLSGYIAADYAHQSLGVPEDEIGGHHLYGKALLILCSILAIVYFAAQKARYNQKTFIGIFRMLLVSVWFLSMITGFRGGEMLLRPRGMVNEEAHE